MLAKGNKQTQEISMGPNTSTASREAVGSLSQPTFQFVVIPTIYWMVDDSLYVSQDLETQICKYTRNRAC